MEVAQNITCFPWSTIDGCEKSQF